MATENKKAVEGLKSAVSQMNDMATQSGDIMERIANNMGVNFSQVVKNANAAAKGYKKSTAELKAMQEIIETITKHTSKLDNIRAQAQEKLTAKMNEYLDKWREMKLIATDPKVAGMLFLGAAVKKMYDFANIASSAQHDIGLSYTQGLKMAGTIGYASLKGLALGIGLKKSAEAAGALATEMGDVSDITSTAILAVAKLSKSYGVSASEGAKLFKSMKQLNSGSDALAKKTLEMSANLARANNVAPGAVMKDIANNTQFFAAYAKQGGMNMTNVAVQAAKLGVSMSAIANMMDGILDIESSLEKEMEVSVLLNRQISFDKARQLAMAGDMVGATKSILQQVGGIAEWERMSVVQRKALAQSAGTDLATMQSLVSNRQKQVEMGLVEATFMEKMLTYGKGIFTTAKENMALASTSLNVAMSLKNLKVGMWIREKAQGLWKAGMWIREKAQGLWKAKSQAQELIMERKIQDTKSKKSSKSGGPASMMKGMKPASMMKGAAAMIVVAAAVFVFGKAVQEFMKVSWSAVGKAVVSMLALVGAVALLGVLMSSGVGAVAIIAGAAAMVIVASSVYILGKALQEMASGFSMMGDLTSQIGQLVTIAPGMALAAAGFLAMGVGIAGMAAGLALITPMLPTLLALGALAPAIGGLTGASSTSSGKANGSSEIAEKLDTLIDLISKGGTINMDGKKVDVIALARGPLGT